MPSLRADWSRPELVHTDELPWEASPSPRVFRKRLELFGPVEAGRVTSVVRYDADSAFAAHDHPDGEEILVLSGVFSDELGDHPAHSYLFNPDGFRHAPFSRDGCTLFVKLRQHPGIRDGIHTDTRQGWRAEGDPGVERRMLYERASGACSLLRLAPGATLPAANYPSGLELFVLSGTAQCDFGALRAGSWLRLPLGTRCELASERGVAVYFRTELLAARAPQRDAAT